MRNPLLISIFSILLSSVAFAQGDIDLGGKPADDGSYKPSLSHDYFSNQGSQFDRCSALVTGEITKISKIRIVSQKEHTGSAKGNWIETKTSYALEFKPRTVIGGKVKGKLIKVLLIRTTEDFIPVDEENPLGDYKVGNKGLLLLSLEKRRWKAENFIFGNTYSLSLALGVDTKTVHSDEKRLLWLEARTQFFNSLFIARKLVTAIAKIRKKSRGKKAFKLLDAANEKITSAIAKLRDQGFPSEYIAVFEAEQSKLNEKIKTERSRLKL